MDHLFAGGGLVDLILALMAIEVVALGVIWRATGRGIAPVDLLPNVLAGAFLLLALRAVLAQWGWSMACAFLAAAGLAHITDLARRWRR